MTIILAGKTAAGIIFCYDLALYSESSIKRRGNQASYSLTEKVIPLSIGKIAVGLSFRGTTYNTEIAKIERALHRNHPRWFTRALDDLVRNDRPSLSAETAPSADSDQKTTSNIQYLIGLVQNQKYRLFQSYEDQPGLQEVECAGIGSGVYPHIQRRLNTGYNPLSDSTTLTAHFQRTIKLAKLSVRQHHQLPLRGIGISILTKQGYRVLSTNPNP